VFVCLNVSVDVLVDLITTSSSQYTAKGNRLPSFLNSDPRGLLCCCKSLFCRLFSVSLADRNAGVVVAVMVEVTEAVSNKVDLVVVVVLTVTVERVMYFQAGEFL
jgi:hypothetical protein